MGTKLVSNPRSEAVKPLLTWGTRVGCSVGEGLVELDLLNEVG